MIWATIAGMALVTYLTRAPMMMLLRGELPTWLRRWLQFVPIAIFTALVLPPFVAPHERIELGLPLLAGLVGAVIAWRTRQVYAVIIGGLIVFWLGRLVS